MELNDLLKQKRPDLSPSTIYSYSSTLRALHKRIFNSTIIDVDNFYNIEAIMEHLKDKDPSIRKTIMATLYTLTELPYYKEQMSKDADIHFKKVATQEMTDKQKEAHRSQQEIMELFKRYESDTEYIYNKSTITNKDKQQIQKYIILALTSGIFIAPRRSLDWCEFKVNNITPNSNYLDGDYFVFNRYKGSTLKGSQIIKCPKELKDILTRWIAINSNDYLLYDQNNNKLTSIKMNQRLNKIFDGTTGINALRHSFLSEKFQSTIQQDNDLSNTMESMGSSLAQKKIYINKL